MSLDIEKYRDLAKQMAEQRLSNVGAVVTSEEQASAAQQKVINTEVGMSDDDIPPASVKDDDKDIEATQKNMSMKDRFCKDVTDTYHAQAKKMKYPIKGLDKPLSYTDVKHALGNGRLTYKGLEGNPLMPVLIQGNIPQVMAEFPQGSQFYNKQGTPIDKTQADMLVKSGQAVRTPQGIRIKTQEEVNSDTPKQVEDVVKSAESADYKYSKPVNTEIITKRVSSQPDAKCDSFVFGNTQAQQVLNNMGNASTELGFSTPNSNPSGLNRMKTQAVSAKTEPNWDDYFKTEKVKGKDVVIKTEDFTDTLMQTIDSTDSIDTAIDTITYYITQDIISKFGANQITELAVSDSRLFVNGIWYKANLNPRIMQEDIPKGEYLYYLGKGLTAYFFDWSYIKKFRNLIEINIDDAKYVKTIVTQTACRRGSAGVQTFFRLQPNLDTLTIGKETITKDKLNTPEATRIKRSVGKAERSHSLLNGWTLQNKSFYEVTDSVQGFGANSFTNYINNRGNKGFIRFALGSTLRFGLAATTTVANLGVHVLGGIKNLIHDGMTSVADNPD